MKYKLNTQKNTKKLIPFQIYHQDHGLEIVIDNPQTIRRLESDFLPFKKIIRNGTRKYTNHCTVYPWICILDQRS